ncbi:MAG TPA: ATP-binding protein [Phototrophicaceae bacterium]|nr:ATP-binding protein [Phototrophicaceae bacterium]
MDIFGLTPATHIAFSAALTSLTTAILGIFVLLRDYRSRVYRVFSFYSLAITAWSGTLAVHVWSSDRSFAILTGQYLHIGAALIPVLFVHFVLEFFGETQRKLAKLFLPVLYGIALILMFLCIKGVLVSDVAPKFGIPYLMIANRGYSVLVAFFVLCAIWGLLHIWRAYRYADGLRKNQLKYLLFGSLLGYAGGVDNFLYLYDVTIFPLFPYGTYAIPIYVTSTAYAIAQYRLLDISVVIKKSLIYASLLTLLLVPCYLLVVWGQNIAFDSINYRFSFFTLLLFLVVGFIFPKIRFRTEEALEGVFFKRRANYRDTLLRSSQDMVSIIEIKALAENLVRTIGKSLGIEKVSLLLKSGANGSYYLEASVGLDFDRTDSVSLSDQGPLVELLQRRREPIIKEELEWVPLGLQMPQTVEVMGMLGAEISLPILSKGKLIGILNLGHKEDKTIYSDEDLELLSTLANQAAIAIENARLYENLKQSQDTLRRADRLSSLGLLTAGLAHEIRNPLVAIRTFTQLLPERYNDAEFREGFQGLALKEVDRICGLINDLLSFARPSKPNVSPEAINDVVENITRILETQAKEKNVAIFREFSDNLPKVWIDREQMKQVFMNLILNAIQAMQEGGSLSIATRSVARTGADPVGEFVQVEIRDTGVGIPEENLQHIFDPFFTSKDEGSGLGLAVSHQIVQEHGGFVTVESTVGKGTAFFVHVPVAKPVRPAANGHAQLNEANLSH